MALADGIRHSISYIAESTYGTTPATPVMQLLRHASVSLNVAKDAITSEEIRDDRNLSFIKHGIKNVSGEITTDLSDGTLDDLFEALSGDTWTADVLKVGTSRKSFSFERQFADIAQYQVFTGVEVQSMSFSVTPGEIVVPTIAFIAQDGSASSSAISGATYTAETTSDPMCAVAASLNEGGSSIAIVTQLDVTIENSMEAKPVVGSALTQRPTYGRCNVTGTLTAYFEDNTLLNKFLNETVSSLDITFSDGTNTYVLDFPKIKYTGGQTDVAGEGGITLPLPFTAYYDTVEDTTFKLTR